MKTMFSRNRESEIENQKSRIERLLEGKAWLRPGEAAVCFGVTSKGLRAIREARPDVAKKFQGLKHWRYDAGVVKEMLLGNNPACRVLKDQQQESSG